MKVANWLRLWYDTYVERSTLAPSTQAMYRRAINAVPSWLGDVDLQDVLLPLHITRWLRDVAAETPRAAQFDRVMFARSLKIASKLGLCAHMAIDTDTVPKPVHEPKKAVTLTAEQVIVYRNAARESKCYPLLMLCLCGLRRGEALGARWQDLDGNVLTIRRQRQRIDGKYQTRALKSEKSHRGLVLPSWLIADLASVPRTITGWIVDTTPERLHNEHTAIIQAAGLPHVTLHGLRHTFAALAAAEGVPMKHLQMALGHSKMQLTADLYADHLSPLSDLPSLVWQAI